MSADASKLASIRDGVPLGDEEARALWKEFSEYMDANRGDLAGFARKKGWFSVAPEFREGRAVLIVRTTSASPAPPPVKAPSKPGPKPRPNSPRKATPNRPAKANAARGGGQSPPGGKASAGGQVPPKKRPG